MSSHTHMSCNRVGVYRGMSELVTWLQSFMNRILQVHRFGPRSLGLRCSYLDDNAMVSPLRLMVDRSTHSCLTQNT